MRELSVQELAEMLRSDAAAKPTLIDVREPWEWELARLPDATLIPMQQIPSRLSEIDSSHPAVVYCHHGVRSLQVVAYLQREGYPHLHNLAGGIDAWSRQVDPSVPLY